MDYSRKALYMSNKKHLGHFVLYPQEGEASRRPY
jgi:hypothetical protein